MDKVLAFSILSASPADIAGGSWARLSWRGRKLQQQDDHHNQAGAGRQGGGGQPAEAAEQGKSQEPRGPRFAPEFDGIDCFETIVWR